MAHQTPKPLPLSVLNQQREDAEKAKKAKKKAAKAKKKAEAGE